MAGVYIHIPFCRQACTYCNFHFSVSMKNKGAMIEAISKEISGSGDFITDKNIETVYIGGGTPSLLTSAELAAIFNTLSRRFIIAGDAEITLEANPDDITPENLNDWLQLGINRLSVGLQSFNEAELRWMNRAHTAAQSVQCLNHIKAAGFTNFSVDLIYGSPLQTNEDLERNFEIVALKGVPHISCYALTVESGTALYRSIEKKQSLSVDPDKQSEQFYILLDLMQAAGYEQYEISNFARPGYRSRHNSSYWQGKPYHGFGPAAHSFDGKTKRRWNVSNNTLFIQSTEQNIIAYEEEILTDIQRLNEYVMTSLRTAEGLKLDIVKNNFGEENAGRIINGAQKYLQGDKMIQTGSGLILTKEGKFFADGIAADLFG